MRLISLRSFSVDLSCKKLWIQGRYLYCDGAKIQNKIYLC